MNNHDWNIMLCYSGLIALRFAVIEKNEDDPRVSDRLISGYEQ